MITIDTYDRCLTKFFIDSWVDSSGKEICKVITQNEEMQEIPKTNNWVRISVDLFSFLADSLGNIGNRRMEREGIISIQIFVPTMTRTKILNQMLSKAISIFEGKGYEGVGFGNPIIRNMEESADSIWFGRVVKIPFSFTEIK